MAGLPIVDPGCFGAGYAVPTAMSRMPVNQLRTANVTRDPRSVAMSMAEYRMLAPLPNMQPVQLLPQRMLFQQHKTGPSGVSRGDPRQALSSATSLTSAMSASRGLVPRVPQHVPTYEEAAAAMARGSQAFTRPEVQAPPQNMGVRVRPVIQPIAPPQQAYGETLEEARNMAAAIRHQGTEQAFRSAGAARDALNRLAGGRR